MIVPRTRLFFWVAVVVLPCGLLSAVQPEAAAAGLIALAALALACAWDARRACLRLGRLRVELPAIVRMSKDRGASFEVRICNSGLANRRVRLAPVTPRPIHSELEELNVELPSDSEWSRFQWNCLPRRKGVFHINTVCLETPSPWGFWDARRPETVSCEIRVYPNLASERKNLAALFLNRGSFGLHVQRQLGKGREFEKLREYLPGDGFEDVHWKATAKRGKPVTKVFQIERTQEIYVIIDGSRLSARTPGAPPGSKEASEPRAGQGAGEAVAVTEAPTALDRYVSAALVLGLVAEQQGDLFGLLAFSDKVDRFVRARNGKAHFSACRDALYTLEPKTVTPDYEELFTFIRLRLRRRALLMFLTALDDPALAESFTRNVQLIRNQHLVLVNMMQPPGVGPLFDGAEPNCVDDLYQRLGGHLMWENLCELEKKLQRRGVKFALLQDERLSVQLVHQYLQSKRRQAL
ncbi:MAG TPA: DUF58 domain-containing protein [Verrucomicrobiae bacterium]|nr:DUF58 domain-containing protein [Verrucomicrobiae bacterium]